MKIENLNKYFLRELLKPKNKEVFILHKNESHTYIGDAFHMYRIPNNDIYIDLSKFTFREASKETIDILFKDGEHELVYTGTLTYETKQPSYVFTDGKGHNYFVNYKFLEFIDLEKCTYSTTGVQRPILIKENGEAVALVMPCSK